MKNNQLAIIDGKSFTEQDVFHAIDLVSNELNKTGDIQGATRVFNSLNSLDTIAGHAKSKLLWKMDAWWKINKQDDFGDYIESMSGTKRITVLRYVNVWEHIEQENIPKSIQGRPMRELIPIANMLSQGVVPSKAEWNKISLCSSPSELGEVIAKIKNKKQRKNARKIVMERDGSINLWKDDKKIYLGFLDVVEAQENEDIAKAIEYILDGRITRK